MPPKPPCPSQAKAKPKYTVIRDTREHAGKGWVFDEGPSCAGTVNRKLDTGDYCLVGYEDVFALDRKGSISEFANNLTEKRFENELARMGTFKLAVILLEFDFDDLARWPDTSGIPVGRRKYMKLNRHVIMAKFWELKLKYPYVEFLFAGTHGKVAVSSLFKRVVELYGKTIGDAKSISRKTSTA